MTASIDTSYGLFLHQLKSIFYLERSLEEELGFMAEEVTSDGLEDALSNLQSISEGSCLKQLIDRLSEM
jgi:ferritin-like metal-binding protein YciE